MPKINDSAHFLMANSLLMTKLNKRLDNHLSVHGISFTEYLVMHQLANSTLKTMRRIELAEKVGISASGVTRLIAPMEKRHLVEKEANPRDARQSLVKLSKTGQQVYKESSISFNHSAADITENITSKQLESLVKLVSAI